MDVVDRMRDLKNLMEFILHLKNHIDLEKVQILVVSRRKINIHQAIQGVSTKIVTSNSDVNKCVCSMLSTDQTVIPFF